MNTSRSGHFTFAPSKLAPLVLVLALLGMPSPIPAFAKTVVIVGTGAVSCSQFLEESRWSGERELRYFPWAQGYMSGILMRAPPGKDKRLNLTPAQFPIAAQIAFLETYCSKHADIDYSDAVAILYKKLR